MNAISMPQIENTKLEIPQDFVDSVKALKIPTYEAVEKKVAELVSTPVNKNMSFDF